MTCPVCGQDVRTRSWEGRELVAPHFVRGRAAPCPGSHRAIVEDPKPVAPATALPLFD